MIELGGNISLSGFKDLDRDSMVIVKKVVGNYAKKMQETNEKFESLKVNLKAVHKTEASKKFEIKTNAIIEGKPFNSESVDRNMFISLDSALNKLVSAISD